ncbi:MAG: DUF4111 domain-containing protein [Anaerolineales bacterium]|nr:DUF4111 domain-containing protein [Anaerolineales bacterium]
MKNSQIRTTIYFDPDIHQALREKAAETDRSISEIVNEAVKLGLVEDTEDLAAFEERAYEPNLLFEDSQKDLKQPGFPTPYPEVNTVLLDLLSQLQAILGDRFVGLYLYGSLASGDFNPHQSDIDFVVVTENDLPDVIVVELEAMHMRLASSNSKWAQKLEGVYIRKQYLPHYNPADPPLPTINEGRFYMGRQGSDWVIQRLFLREQGTIIAGPSLQDSIDPVYPQDLRKAVQAILSEWWQPILRDPARMETPEYQPYAVLSMCRALYTLEHGRVASKGDSAMWAMTALDQEWAGLIKRSLAWRRGQQTESIERTLDFIRFTIERSKQFNATENLP